MTVDLSRPQVIHGAHTSVQWSVNKHHHLQVNQLNQKLSQRVETATLYCLRALHLKQAVLMTLGAAHLPQIDALMRSCTAEIGLLLMVAPLD